MKLRSTGEIVTDLQCPFHVGQNKYHFVKLAPLHPWQKPRFANVREDNLILDGQE